MKEEKKTVTYDLRFAVRISTPFSFKFHRIYHSGFFFNLVFDISTRMNINTAISRYYYDFYFNNNIYGLKFRFTETFDSLVWRKYFDSVWKSIWQGQMYANSRKKIPGEMFFTRLLFCWLYVCMQLAYFMWISEIGMWLLLIFIHTYTMSSIIRTLFFL